MSRRWLATTVLFVSAVLVALALGEGAVRLFRPGYVIGPDPIRNSFWRHDPDIGWSHPPGMTGTFSRDEFTHPVVTNRWGWRDIEREIEKGPGAFRIAVLGDSFTWGHGVADEEMFTRLLEAELGVEVLNFGLSASSTDQQLLILRKYVWEFSPDLVLVMVTRNDYEGNLESSNGSYPKPRFVMDEEGDLELTNIPVPQPSRLALWHNRMRRASGLLNLVESFLSSGEEEAKDPGSNPYEMMQSILALMRDEAREHGASLAVSFAPSTAHTYPETISTLEARRVERLSAICGRLGIPFLDLVPEFRVQGRSPGGEKVFHHYIYDKHWNALGHLLAARELARMLRQQGLVPVDGADPRL